MCPHRPTSVRVVGWAFALLLLSSWATPGIGGTPDDRKTITVGVVRGFEPDYKIAANGRVSGFAVDVMDEVSRRAGVTVIYRIFRSWQQLIDAFRDGKIDVVPSIAVTPDRKALGSFSVPFQTTRIGLFERSSARKITSIDSLIGRRIAVVRGESSGPQLAESYDLHTVSFPTPDVAVRALIAGKVDIFAYPVASARHLIKQLGRERDIIHSGPIAARIPRAMLVRKDRPDLIALLEPQLAKFAKSVAFDNLYRHWFTQESPSFLSWADLICALAILVVVVAAGIGAYRLYNKAISSRLKRRDPEWELANRTVAVALCINATVVILAIATLYFLYRVSFEQVRSDLLERTHVEASFIKSVARFDLTSQYNQAEARKSTLTQIQDGFDPIRSEIEILVAERVKNNVRFLLRQDAAQPTEAVLVPFGGRIAEPMQLALSGKTGSVVAADYRGEQVLAAYEPIDVLGVGLVVKKDIRSIEAPFIRAGLLVVSITVAFTVIGTFIFFKAIQPLVRRVLHGEERFRSLAHLTADWFWETDTEQRFTYLNASDTFPGTAFVSQKWIGKTRPEMHQHLQTDENFSEIVQSYIDLGKPFQNIKGRFVHPERGETWVSISGTPIYNNEGEVVGYRGVGRNITTEMKRERMLQESEEKFRQIAENIREVFWISDPQKNKMLYVSPIYEEIWGRSAQSLYANPTSFIDAIHPEDRDRVQRAVAVQAATTYDEEYRIIRPDGTVRWIRDRAFPVMDASGEPYRIVGIAEDITDAREGEHRLRQAQKLESVGQLTGGIAHDFNNLLTVVLGNSRRLERRIGDDQELGNMVDAITTAARRGAELIKRLLAFSRKQRLEAEIVSIKDLLGELRIVLDRTLEETIDLHLVCEGDQLFAFIDPVQLEAAILNLAVNARDAMPTGGKLTISASRVPGRSITADAGLAAGADYIELSVEDSGVGMPANVLQHVFEPFFTTKAVGKGTGLGLSMVFGFAKQSNGHVLVESDLGKGTTFRLYLPAAEVPAEKKRSEIRPDLPRSETNRGTVLLVEDEASVRQLAAEILNGLGYKVIEAPNGPSAVEILKADLPIDLLFTDIVMPGGMTGPELAEFAVRCRPDIKILLTTGYDSKAFNVAMQAANGDGLIVKPYEVEELAAKVSKILDAEAGGTQRS